MTRRRNHTEEYRNEGPHNKYFTVMLNMADDDLDPFEYRLLGHYIRVCGMKGNGVCRQSVRTVADVTHMSIPKVIATRNALLEKGWIRVDAAPNKAHKVTVIDRMAENISRYVDQDIEHDEHNSGGDQYIDRGVQNIDRGDQYPANEEEPTKKNTQETTTTTATTGVVVDVDFDLRKQQATEVESIAKSLVAVQTGDAAPPAPATSDALASVVAAYEDNIGLVTQMLRDELIDAVDEYPADWIIDAIRVAVTQNVRKWKYALAVLENWKKNGRIDAGLNGKTQAKVVAEKRKAPPMHYPRPVPDCETCGGTGSVLDAQGKMHPCPDCLAAEEAADEAAA
jgi:DnaD/phage-associated family protein